MAYLGHAPEQVDAALEQLERAGKLRFGIGQDGSAVVHPALFLTLLARRRAEVQRRAVRGGVAA